MAEAEQQLAQLRLNAGNSPGAKEPLTEALSEKGAVAEEPKVAQSRPGRAAKENRRSSADTSAAAAHRGASAQKGAAGVSAMRAFWETAGQPAEKPRAGACTLSRIPLPSARPCDMPGSTIASGALRTEAAARSRLHSVTPPSASPI